MTIQAGQLLKRLEPVVRPVESGAATPPRLPHESLDFDELMTLVSRGEVRSDREVAVAAEAAGPLSDAQLERLASAADFAEARGSRKAVMLIDGRGLVMDIPERRVLDELRRNAGAIVHDVDSAVFVADPEAIDESANPLTPGTGIVWSAPVERGNP